MPREPTLTPIVAPWGFRAEGHRARSLALWGVVGSAILLLAAWAIPPLLDWGRFRTQIAAIAAVRLGRPVVIGGEISLRLLPLAVLTATDVTLADPGDGVSVQVSALRLQVATLPLLAGHVRLRELVLGAPVLRLPLSLPDGIAHPTRPQIPHVFAARIESGTLRIGQTEITGITATVHGGPSLASATGSMQETLAPGGTPVAAFGAEGFASVGGRSWRFTTALGAPDADGVSAVDISVRGQARVAETGGTVQATLADGTVQGRLRAGGPDLSLLLPASALAWRVDAPFVASAERIETTAIALSLGGAPADGALTLQLAAPARLDGRLHAASLDLDGWAGLLGRTFGTEKGHGAADVSQPGLPQLRIELSADTAQLLGGTLHDLHGALVSDGSRIGFDHPRALLPGGAVLSAAQARLSDTDDAGTPAPLAVSAPASLDAPDLRATLAWLRPLAPSLVDALPDGVARTASVSGDLTLQKTGMSITGLHGRLDASPIAGDVVVRLAPRAAVAATVAFGELHLDPWLAPLGRADTLSSFASHFSGTDIDLHLTAGRAGWLGEMFTDVAVDAAMGEGGLVVRAAHATLAGSSLTMAGGLAADGRVQDLRMSAASPDLALLQPHLPARWHWAPGLWHGPATLAFAASGPPEALGLQLRADASDVVLEAEATRDTGIGAGPVTLTVRHPGAPRLLAALGLPASFVPASAWLDSGSLTLRAHLQTAPGQITAEDFDLDAAALRLSGHLVADWSDAAPTLSGSIDAEQLALPDSLPSPGQVAWLEDSWMADWATQLHIAARSVLVGLRPVASDFVADIEGAGTSLFADIAARAAGGQLVAQVATGYGPPDVAGRLSWTGIEIASPLAGWPVDIGGGTADLQAELHGPEAAASGLSGTIQATLHGTGVIGLDAAKLASGTIDARLAQGVLVIDTANLASGTGQLAVGGGANLVAGTVDLHVAGVHLSGPFGAVRTAPDLPPAQDRLKRRRVRPGVR